VSEKIHFRSVFTAKKFHGCGLMSRMAKFAISEHPIIKNAKYCYVFCENLGSETVFTRAGFTKIAEFPYQDFVADGLRVFENLEEVTKTHKLRGTDKIRVLRLECADQN